MELLKSNPVIDKKYKPAPNLDYQEYFNRAMVFAQTNYQEQLDKVAKTQFRKLSPTSFFEEYVWCVCCVGEEPQTVSEYFPALTQRLTPFYHSFWDLNNFPKQEEIKERVLEVFPNHDKFHAIINCASIINKGIKLYGWDFYRDNFLNKPEKLVALPMMGIVSSRQLARNVGASAKTISSSRLYNLASHWGFVSVDEMCKTIQKHVPMQIKVIELILWYAATTFECP
jgi:hypothetical protein